MPQNYEKNIIYMIMKHFKLSSPNSIYKKIKVLFFNKQTIYKSTYFFATLNEAHTICDKKKKWKKN